MLKKLGEPPFDLGFEVKCIGIPGSKKSSDEILLVEVDVDGDNADAVLYVDEIYIF